MNGKDNPTIGVANVGADGAELLLSKALRQLVREEISAADGRADAWIDQASSPLGRRLHTRLWRSGRLPGRKFGRRVLVRKSDVDRYIETAGATALPSADKIDRDLAELGFGNTLPTSGARS